MPLRHGHADRRRDALSQRTGRRFDAFGDEILGVARGRTAQLAEVANVIAADTLIARQKQERIDQHRAMARRQNEPVTISPIRISGIVLHEFAEQNRGGVCHTKWQTHMARLGAFDCINGKCADGVGHIPGGNRHTSTPVFDATGNGAHGQRCQDSLTATIEFWAQ